MQHLTQIIKKPADGRYPHGGAIAPAVIRLRINRMDPAVKLAAIAGIRIPSAVKTHGIDNLLPDGIIVLAIRLHQPICNGNSHHAVIRRPAAGTE